MFYYSRVERLACIKNCSLLGPFVSCKEERFCESGPQDCIHKTLFSLQLKNEANKIRCYITVEKKGLPV